MNWQAIRQRAAIVAIVAAIAATLLALALSARHTPTIVYRNGVPTRVPDTSTLAPCRTEDSEQCYWLANVQGNGRGRSFVRVNGTTFYIGTGRPSYETASAVCQSAYFLTHSDARDTCVDVLADLVAVGAIERPRR